MKAKKYKIGGAYWFQCEPLYADNERLREIFRGKFDLHAATQDKIGEVIERLYEGGVLRQAMPFILKPDNGNVWKRWRNRRAGITADTVIEHMTDSDIARVMLDFFVFKVKWVQSLFDSLNGLNFLAKVKAVTSRLNRKKSPFDLPAAIHLSPKN